MQNTIECIIIESTPLIAIKECFYEMITEKTIYLYTSNNEPLFHISEIQLKHINEEKYCLFRNCRFYLPGKDFDSFTPTECFITENRESLNNLDFTEMRFQISNEILNFFDHPWDYSNYFISSDNKQTITFLDTNASKFEISLAPNFKFYIFKYHNETFNPNSYSAIFNIEFALLNSASLNYKLLINYSNCFTLFFNLFTHEQLNTYNIRYELNGLTTKYYFPKHFKPNAYKFQNFLIKESDFTKIEFELIINNLLHKHLIYSNLLSLINDYNSVKNEELKYICLFRIIEAFHRNLMEINYTSKEELIKSIEAYKKKYYPELINIRIKNNSIPLLYRLLDVIRLIEEFVRSKENTFLLGKFCKVNELRKYIDTRNYFTHFSEKKVDLIKTDELFIYSMQLNTLCKIAILKSLGMTTDTLAIYISNTKREVFN